MKKLLLTACLWGGISVWVRAQEKIAITERDYGNPTVEMADTFRKEGKIYVVVGTLGTVLAGMFVYLIMLDRKITKIEKSEP
ncbi:MAG: CcmD family protein [Cytophagales bacterium]|nr:CcmD family protein [Bernardetiaceae bacterium]MDW8203915.1 CcmD family protein [Cytophagales bacterium]